MKFFLPLLLLLISPGLMAQDDKEPETVTYTSLLQPGEFFSFGRNSIHFKEVVSDSRCPKDVTCVWAGEAKILVELYENGSLLKEKILTLSSSKIPLEFSVQGTNYSINKMVLYPYPTTKLVDPEYSLEIMILEEVI